MSLGGSFALLATSSSNVIARTPGIVSDLSSPGASFPLVSEIGRFSVFGRLEVRRALFHTVDCTSSCKFAARDMPEDEPTYAGAPKLPSGISVTTSLRALLLPAGRGFGFLDSSPCCPLLI